MSRTRWPHPLSPLSLGFCLYGFVSCVEKRSLDAHKRVQGLHDHVWRAISETINACTPRPTAKDTKPPVCNRESSVRTFARCVQRHRRRSESRHSSNPVLWSLRTSVRVKRSQRGESGAFLWDASKKWGTTICLTDNQGQLCS